MVSLHFQVNSITDKIPRNLDGFKALTELKFSDSLESWWHIIWSNRHKYFLSPCLFSWIYILLVINLINLLTSLPITFGLFPNWTHDDFLFYPILIISRTSRCRPACSKYLVVCSSFLFKITIKHCLEMHFTQSVYIYATIYL